MTNAEIEFWKKFAASCVRQFLTIIGTFLAGHGWISSEQAGGLTSVVIVEFVLSFLLLFGNRLWAWAKTTFDVKVVRAARDAPTDKPIGVITTETLAKQKLISSV